MPSKERADSSEDSSDAKEEKEKVVKMDADGDKKMNDNDAEFTIQLDDDSEEEEEVVDNNGVAEESSKAEEDVKRSSTPPPEEEKVKEVEDVRKKDHKEVRDGTDTKAETEEKKEDIVVEENNQESVEPEEETKISTTPEAGATPVPLNASTEEPATGEVVEEVPLSVKEQIAAFSKLKLQETHGKPKPGVASAFAPKPAPSLPTKKAVPPPEEATVGARPQVNQLFENPQPKPFYAALEPINKPEPPAEAPRVDAARRNVAQATTTTTTDFVPAEVQVPGNQQQPLNGERKPSYEQPRPQQQQLRPQQHTSSTKWTPTVAKAEAPMWPNKLAQFGTVYTEPRLTQAPDGRPQTQPKKYIGPEIVSRSTGPSQMVCLRRQNSEINWGFAVFGGADFGCPPFISRVSLLSIAGKAGLEVGDIIVSICNSPVQGKQHSEVKAEILRAGNELDFMIIKQGIDKTVLSEKVPEVLQPAAQMEPQAWQSVQREAGASADPYRTMGRQQYPSPRTVTTGNSPYRPIRTNSLRLLDEHLANMSTRPKNEPTIRVYTMPTHQAEPSSRTDYTSDYYTTSTVVRTNRNINMSHPQTVFYTARSPYQQQPPSYEQLPGALSPRPYFASSAYPIHTVQYVSAEPSPRGTAFAGTPYDSLSSQVYYGSNTVRTQPLKVTTMSNSYQPQQQQQYNYTQSSGQVYSRPTYYDSYDPDPERWSTTGTTTQTRNSCWL
ncbi:hypothetical protein SprV_0100095700 [Sparganum proliferum]